MRTSARSFVRAALAGVVLLACQPTYAQRTTEVYNPAANDSVHAIATQPDGRIVVGGAFTWIGPWGGSQRIYLARFQYDGFVEHAFRPAPNGQVYAIAVQPDGKILIGGAFNQINGTGGNARRQRLARLNGDGTTDPTFDPGVNGSIRALAVQRDGRILVAGDFTTIGGGGSGFATRRYVARLNADGSLDPTFDVGANGSVRALAVQPDGRIVLGGFFTTLGGGLSGTTPRRYLGRINPDGSLDAAFDPGATGVVSSIAIHADRRIVVGGAFVGLGGATGSTPRQYVGRLHPDGSVDAAFNPGASDRVNVVSLQPDGRVLVGGEFTTIAGCACSRLTRLNMDGSVDQRFDSGADGPVGAIALQPGGHVIVAGSFTALGGGTGTTPWGRLGRFAPDGSLETTFAGEARWVRHAAAQPDGHVVVTGSVAPPGRRTRTLARLTRSGYATAFDPGIVGSVMAVAVQPDGKIVLDGLFSKLGDGGTTPRNNLGRLNADGSVDVGFNPGVDGWVKSVVVEPGGSILVAGRFTRIGGGGTGSTPRAGLARLDAEGSVDHSFNPPPVSGWDTLLARQPDGKVIVGAEFFTGTTSGSRLLRLNRDGSIDNTFTAVMFDQPLVTLLVQPDGKVLAGGDFRSVWGDTGPTSTRNRIARFNADGSLDAAFNPDANDSVRTIALQADGKILVAGAFTAIAGRPPSTRRPVARLHPDGSFDGTFHMAAGGDYGNVEGLSIQDDGRLLVAGGFDAIQFGLGPSSSFEEGFASFTNTEAPDEQLTVSRGGTAIRWRRGGTAAQFAYVAFDVSTDGTAYSPLGEAAPVPGGWQLTGLDLPQETNLFIRARGFTVGGTNGRSLGIIESIVNIFVAPEFATFTDPALQAGHVLRTVHIRELRTRVDALRAQHDLSAFSWTDPALSAGFMARASHMRELRSALQEAYTAAGEQPPSFTDSTLAAGVTMIKAVHLLEVRNAVLALESLTFLRD